MRGGGEGPLLYGKAYERLNNLKEKENFKE
jgi:hypothetical protein